MIAIPQPVLRAAETPILQAVKGNTTVHLPMLTHSLP
jgi:hypothetical protein